MLCLLSQPQGRSGFGAGAGMSLSPTSAPALAGSPLHRCKTSISTVSRSDPGSVALLPTQAVGLPQAPCSMGGGILVKSLGHYSHIDFGLLLQPDCCGQAHEAGSQYANVRHGIWTSDAMSDT